MKENIVEKNPKPVYKWYGYKNIAVIGAGSESNTSWKKKNYDNGWSSHSVSCYCHFWGPLCLNTISPEQRDSVSRTDTGWKLKAIIPWGYRKPSCASCLSEIEIYFFPIPRASRPVAHFSPSSTPLFRSSLSQGFHGLPVKANCNLAFWSSVRLQLFKGA